MLTLTQPPQHTAAAESLAPTAATAAAASPDYMATPTHALHERSMLLKLTSRMWSAKVTDTKLAKQTATATASDATLHGHTRRLLTADHLSKISASNAAIKAYWYANTLPWTDDGTRVLKTSRYLHVKAELDRLIAHHTDTLIPEFLAAYPYYREEIRRMAGPLFDPNEYPHPNVIAAKFGVTLTGRPMPNYTDWRAEGIPPEMLADLAAAATADLEATVKQQQRTELFGRLRKVVAHMAERLPLYTGGRTGSFHPTIVTNIQEILDMFPNVMVMDDPELTAIAATCRALLTTYDADTLRENTPIREDTAESAAAIVKAIDAFGA